MLIFYKTVITSTPVPFITLVAFIFNQELPLILAIYRILLYLILDDPCSETVQSWLDTSQAAWSWLSQPLKESRWFHLCKCWEFKPNLLFLLLFPLTCGPYIYLVSSLFLLKLLLFLSQWTEMILPINDQWPSSKSQGEIIFWIL